MIIELLKDSQIDPKVFLLRIKVVEEMIDSINVGRELDLENMNHFGRTSNLKYALRKNGLINFDDEIFRVGTNYLDKDYIENLTFNIIKDNNIYGEAIASKNLSPQMRMIALKKLDRKFLSWKDKQNYLKIYNKTQLLLINSKNSK